MPSVAKPRTAPPSPPKPLGRPPERVVLTFYFKMAFSAPPVIKTVTWPKAWPVPSQGDQIVIEDMAGIVNNLSFHPDTGVLIVNLR